MRYFVYKTLFILGFTITNSFACPVYETPVPVADTSVNIEAKKSKTSFNIVWEFKEFFIESLLSEHDKNKNGKFDKDEQDDIKNELIAYIEKNNFITEVAYVKKGQRVKKNSLSKIDAKSTELLFTKSGIKYSYRFDTDFVLQKDHRLFLRFLDPQEKVHVALKDIALNNYNGKNYIKPQDIRANIYFYETKRKSLKQHLSMGD